MNFFERLLSIDRRWIFLMIGIAVVIPFFVPLGLPVIVTRPVQQLYDAVDEVVDVYLVVEPALPENVHLV